MTKTQFTKLSMFESSAQFRTHLPRAVPNRHMHHWVLARRIDWPTFSSGNVTKCRWTDLLIGRKLAQFFGMA